MYYYTGSGEGRFHITCFYLGFFFVVFLFVFGHTHGIWKFPSPGINFELQPSCGNTRSLTHCTRAGVKPAMPETSRIASCLPGSGNFYVLLPLKFEELKCR